VNVTRCVAPAGVIVDLLTASSGLEAEVIARAPKEQWTSELRLRVARREELVALKALSMTDRRPQDRSDALGLREAGVDEPSVERNLRLIEERGIARKQDLLSKYRAL
jgi:hypothetical protein